MKPKAILWHRHSKANTEIFQTVFVKRFNCLNIKPVWKDVFANSGDQTLDLYFKDLGEHFHDFYNCLKQQQKMRFCLTASQQQAFNAYFAQAQVQFLALYGDDYIATVRRLGLITFRISMILTVLRLMETNQFVSLLICSDTDFNSALEMVKILVQVAKQLEIPDSTADKQIARFCNAGLITRQAYGNYVKTAEYHRD